MEYFNIEKECIKKKSIFCNQLSWMLTFCYSYLTLLFYFLCFDTKEIAKDGVFEEKV